MKDLADPVICVVDDDDSVRVAVGALLKSAGYAARTFASAELFLEAAPAQTFGCLVTDLSMPGVDGLELQRRLRRRDSTLPIIFISAHDDASKRLSAMSAGAAGFFRKPFDGEALLAAIEAVIRPRNGQASSPGFVAAPQEMLSSQHCVEASPDARTHLKRDREGYTMTAVQSVRGVRCAHAPPQESDSDLAPAIKNLLEISLALLGSEELTLRLYDQSVSAPPALACESSVQTAARSGEGGIRTGAGEAGPSVQRFAAEAAVLREALTGPNLRSRLLVDSSGRVLGVLTARFAHSDDLSEGERRAFDFSAEALEIVISSAGREEQARTSADDLIKRNAELESSNTRLVCSNQELERFATAASHDLQEPLRTISMYAELLSVKHTVLLDEDAVGLVNSISQSARSLSALLRDLMTYAKVEVTGDASTLPAVDLNRVVQKAIRNVGTSAAECGASITVDPLPTVLALEIHVLQLFQNLISNAIKYRGELPPKIHITSCSTSDQLEFIVSDNGIGIDPQYQDRIFEAFRRLRANGSSGSGMGLTICQRIVSRYAGRIWVESRTGAGAAFHFTLPKAAVVPPPVNGSWQMPSGRTPAILLVDDSPADASLFRLALSEAALDCHLTVITDGAAALTYLRQVAPGVNGGLPDLMVLDLHLPKYDGIEILEAMAGSAVLTAMPVVVWSSLLLQQDREALKRFPFVTSIGKPSMLEEFLNIGLHVQNLLGEPRTSPRI